PYVEEPRHVKVQKGSEPLGISIVSGEKGGIYVSKFNGINLRSATEQQARLIIGQQCDTITILATVQPPRVQLSSHSRSRIAGDTNKKTLEPRVVFIKKSQLELGVHLCGGNLHGVFVAEVEDDSPAKGPDGLVPGDLILEYGRDVRNKTVEEVYVEMLKPKDGVRLKVQYRPEEFTKAKGLPGDSFYIRALYDRLADVEHELSFKKDILYVDDTLPRARSGPGWLGSWTRMPRRSSVGRFPANM
ncbi:hypothetical protein H8958_015728, partial [Nasalis larvatus]